jgi:hypothetical protein
MRRYFIGFCLMGLISEAGANDIKWTNELPTISQMKKRADAYWKSMGGNVDYLPLNGGSLTGSLYGTSAYFLNGVGLGINGNTSKLDIFASSGDHMRFIGRSSSDYSDMVFYANDNITRLGYIDWSNSFMRINAEASIPMLFHTSSIERLRITSSGHVGIGTSAPSHKLQISGGDIAFDAEQTERFIRINNSFGGAIRFRGNAVSSLDRSLQFGRFDGNNNWSSLMTIETNNGNVGVGLENPTEKFTVNGNVKAKKIIVSQTNWPDYVFDSSYVLRSLLAVEKFITQNKRLPDMPSAKEVAQKGISVGDNQALLLKKIEELTLYVIELKKENIKQQEEINALKKINEIHNTIVNHVVALPSCYSTRAG